jgi:hypothetical protein
LGASEEEAEDEGEEEGEEEWELFFGALASCWCFFLATSVVWEKGRWEAHVGVL